MERGTVANERLTATTAAGPGAGVIGISTTLWIGAAWIVVTTALVLCVRDVRDFHARPVADALPVTQS